MRALNLMAGLLPAFMLNIVAAASAAPLGTPDPESIRWPGGFPASEQQIELGKMLFFDKRLSRNETQSCATCHNPDHGFSDGMTFSLGDKGEPVGRNTPAVHNLGWSRVFFWDGRARSLEEQALGPIQAAGEMNMPLDKLEKRLAGVKGYRHAFKAAFGSEDISSDRIAVALAAFERTLISNNAPYDRYLAGDKEAMSPAAQRGLALFEGKADCAQCHDGDNFSDDSFHNIGLNSGDPGRGKIINDKDFTGAFKTPGLRNVALTGPYMHDGSLSSLEEVMQYYNRGGDAHSQKSTLIRPLKLTEQEVRDLVAFMGALTDKVEVVRPQLPVE